MYFLPWGKKKENKPDVAKTKNTSCELINRVKITEQRFSDLEHNIIKAEEQRGKKNLKKRELWENYKHVTYM